jgi:hypothetical protein
MHRLFKTHLLFLCLLLSYWLTDPNFPAHPASSVYSQENRDSYRLREDQFDPRKEGIKEYKIKPVTSDKIVLISALIGTDLSYEIPMPGTIKLGFYTTQRTAASVGVSCEPKSYYVDPLWDHWGPGIAVFKWPTDIMERYQIPPDELFAKATFVEQANRIVYPVCLYFRDLPDTVRGYQFVVTPLRKMKMQYWIMDVDTDDFIVTGTQQSVDAYKQNVITWNCRDDMGNDVQDGEYLLKVQGIYKPRFGKQRTVSVSYRFYHKTNLNE